MVCVLFSMVVALFVGFSVFSRRRVWQPTPVFLPREFHGQRSLAGYIFYFNKIQKFKKSAISQTKVDYETTYFLLIFIRVQLLSNAVLVSTVQQNESAIHIHSSPPYWIPSHSGHHRTLSRSPCAIQYVLISYSLYIQYQQHTCVSPNNLIFFMGKSNCVLRALFALDR